MNAGRIPSISEAGFRKEYLLMWTLAGAGCVIVGLLVGPIYVRAREAWLIDLMAIFVYLLSLLLGRAVLPAIWRRSSATAPVLFFSIPMGGICLAAVLLIRWLGPTLSIRPRTVHIFALTLGLMYAASLVWGVGVGIRRKQLGDFDMEQLP